MAPQAFKTYLLHSCSEGGGGMVLAAVKSGHGVCRCLFGSRSIEVQGMYCKGYVYIDSDTIPP